MVREIKFFVSEHGRNPIEEFLDSLLPRQAQKVTWVMRLVEELKVVPKKFFKKMPGTDDIWEIRVEFESNIFRILGFFDGTVLFIAAHVFQKKSQRIPEQEILTAENRKKEYFRRKKNERS
jgi:phage-related protein